jgi:hypothetical protein
MQVIFTRPLKLGKKLFPRGKFSVEVEDKLLESVFAQNCLKLGWIITPAAPKSAAAASPAKAK